MPAFPAYKTKPYYGELKTWLTTALNDDGTLRSDAVQAEVQAALASEPTVVAAAEDAAAAAVENNPTFLAQEERVDRVDPGAVGDDGTAIVYEASVPHARRLGFWDVDWSGATSYPEGTAYASMTDSSAAINAGVAKAKALGVPVVGRGTYRVDGTVTLDADADFTRSTFVTEITTLSPVVRVGVAGGTDITALRVVAPRVVQSAHVKGAGWGTDVGVEIRNAVACEISVPHVEGFGVGLWMTADGTLGCVHNIVTLGKVLNNRVGVLQQADSIGSWVNANNVYGGDWQHNSSEGTSVAGVRHIAIRRFVGGLSIGNNRFWGPSIEGMAPEYHLEITGGSYNAILQPRWEANAAGNKVLLDNAYRNTIERGSADGEITYTIASGAAMNRVGKYTGDFWQYGGEDNKGGLILSNTTASGAILTLMYSDATPETDQAAAYVGRFSRNAAQFKRETDPAARIQLDFRTPEIRTGTGSVAPLKVLGTRRTGWTAATGTATRTTFDTSTVTTAQLAERLKALIDDLTTHGLIGP